MNKICTFAGKVALVICFAGGFNANAQSKWTDFLKSPDTGISVAFSISENGQALYQVKCQDDIVIASSRLGLSTNDADFTQKLTLDSVSQNILITDSYELFAGKRTLCNYKANQRTIWLHNAKKQHIAVVFNASNDGVAFRYYLSDKSDDRKTITSEETTFGFPLSAKAWLQPMSLAKTGFCLTNPSYEEHHQQAIAVGTPAPTQAGWVFPALFNVGKHWAFITEAAVDRSFCGSRLCQNSPDGQYKIGYPSYLETFTNGGELPSSTLPWATPWRVICVGSLATIVESTLGTDLAKPLSLKDVSFVKPGQASWSWGVLKDESMNYETQKRFITYASQMHWRYCLMDAYWDTNLGDAKTKELADYASSVNVSIWVWYNSSGDWNSTPQTPKSKLTNHADRVREFSRLNALGVKGIKVDFFGGDGQSMMAYYQDILEDAAAYKLLVNFHGATLPRGWERTYPNLLTAEAIKGFEFISFGQFDANAAPTHEAMQPFTRNAFDPMDFTPVCLGPIPGIDRQTTNAQELALSVVFFSGIQHFVETDQSMAKQPDYVQAYMKNVPERWDETKFIDGYPGKLAVIARRSGKLWYVAGINGENISKTLTLNLKTLNLKSPKMFLITDGADKYSCSLQKPKLNKLQTLTVTLSANGGFVAVVGDDFPDWVNAIQIKK
jgi:hypothetical protein